MLLTIIGYILLVPVLGFMLLIILFPLLWCLECILSYLDKHL